MPFGKCIMVSFPKLTYNKTLLLFGRSMIYSYSCHCIVPIFAQNGQMAHGRGLQWDLWGSFQPKHSVILWNPSGSSRLKEYWPHTHLKKAASAKLRYKVRITESRTSFHKSTLRLNSVCAVPTPGTAQERAHLTYRPVFDRSSPRHLSVWANRD